MYDPVNHPKHYTAHPSGVECITITRHMGFNLGNALKYIWRCDLKKDAIEDLRKARWYIDEEIKKRVEMTPAQPPTTGSLNMPLNQGAGAYAVNIPNVWGTVTADKAHITECGK